MVSIILWKSVRFFIINSLKKTSQVEIWKMVWTNVFFSNSQALDPPKGNAPLPLPMAQKPRNGDFYWGIQI